MRRAIIVPPVLAVEALAELKDWLAITTTRDDASLTALLRAALETCEAFTGTMPLIATCEEVHVASNEWSRLGTAPVNAIAQVEVLANGGGRSALPVDAYMIDITADGCGRVRLVRSTGASRVVVQFDAGLAADWAGLPEGVRHGVIRLAAHNYRERDGGAAKTQPPAAVTALWQPWRRMRLA